MDLKIVGAEPSAEERAAIDGLLGSPATYWDGGEREVARDGREARSEGAAQGRRDLLLPAFHAVQDRCGWVSHGALNHICRRLHVPPAEAWGVLTFYHLFAVEKRPPAVIHVCDDLACRLRGAERLCGEFEARLGPPGGAEGTIGWQRSPCLGLCERAPAVLCVKAGDSPRAEGLAPCGELDQALALLSGEPLTQVDRLTAVRSYVPQAGSTGLGLLRRVGMADPTSFDDYCAHGGYQAFNRGQELGRQGLIDEVTAANLVGRGGAAFPTGRKWAAVAAAPATPHFLICNADESEPGTFKDRVLLEDDPYAIVEAMTLVGWATGCERGIVYLRGEYPLAHRRLQHAIDEVRGAGLLGRNVAGLDFAFDLEIRRGAGAYICGEETALFNSIEGKRGEPRSKPPFPVEVGLFGKPTVVNNVETLANLLEILRLGAKAWAALGTAGSAGTKLFCVSGQVVQPGLYEVPFGRTLGELLDLAGGMLPGRRLRAILLGGAAGVFVGPAALDLPLTFEATRAAGATLGSGVVMVYDDQSNLGDALLRIAEFFRHESCGQCVPCRVGTVRQLELLERLHGAHGDAAAELALLRELGQAMRDASICGLGQTASSAIESALRTLDPFQLGGSA